jgi:hypothetical protein
LKRRTGPDARCTVSVLRRVARVHARSLEERLHVFLEGENGLVREERAADLIADGL